MVFSVAYHDQGNMESIDKGESIYLHRIVINPEFKGQKLFVSCRMGNRSYTDQRITFYPNGHMGC